MKEVEAFKKVDIISYKHDGSLHRVWKKADKIYEDKEQIILINDEIDVIDGDGRKWKTREPAVCFFYKKYWFNIICMIREKNIYYYCNLSSPYVVDTEGIKYIDYDLDVKVFPDGTKIELDRDEYEFNKKQLHYKEDLDEIIEKNLLLLIDRINTKADPFNSKCVMYWYKKFYKYRKESNYKKNFNNGRID